MLRLSGSLKLGFERARASLVVVEAQLAAEISIVVDQAQSSQLLLGSLDDQVVSVQVEKADAAEDDHILAHGVLQTQLSRQTSQHFQLLSFNL